jgi:hypothetical protein
MPSKSDKEFGRIALKKGFLTREQLEECLSLQRDLEKTGTPTTLERVLLAKALLDPARVTAIQNIQKRRIVFCECGTRVNVFKYAPGKRLYCRKCRTPLVVPTVEELEASLHRVVDAEVADIEPNQLLPLPSEADTIPNLPPPDTPPTAAVPPAEEATGPGHDLLLPSSVIQDRKILEKIGEGGMGAVFRAVHQKLERQEAFKIIKPLYAENTEYRAKFLREARIAARLKHPNITQVYDIVDTERVLGYTMEFVDGEPLSAVLLRQKTLDPGTVLGLLRQLASALVCFHQAGIVHRDIKPGNVLVDKSGNAVLTDLGLAKDVSGAGKSGYTSEGTTLGTPAYMAPELIQRALYADIRSDIYSLGALAYHALSGSPPFKGESVYDFITAILSEVPLPLSEAAPGVPPELSRIVDRMLQKDPKARFQTPEELLKEIEKAHA